MNVSVRPSLAVFWLQTKLSLTETMVSGTAPNTIFGIIPVGRTEISQPLNRVSRVQVSTKVGTGAILLTAVFVLLAISTGSAVWWILAVVAGAGAYRAELEITDSGGGKQSVGVSPLDRDAIQKFAATVNQQLAAAPS